MKHFLRFAPFLAAAWLALPVAASAATVAQQQGGRILIDVSGHGEAWYVNPQTLMRVSLGRPHEALPRLIDRAVPVNQFHIDRLAATAGAAADAEYSKAVAGHVLRPNDLPGAIWYVDPSGIRHRLLTPEDAWALMRSGTGASKATLAAIPVEPVEKYDRPRVQTVKVKSVVDAVTLELEDGAKLRILNVDVPANPDLQKAAMDRITAMMGEEKTIAISRDLDDRLQDFTLLRHVYARGANVGLDMVGNGLAFHDIIDGNFEHAEQMIVAGLDAMRLKRGFWNRGQ